VEVNRSEVRRKRLGNPKLADEALRPASPVIEYASLELRTDWQRLSKKTARAKMLALLGIGKSCSTGSPK
jgi:hypothetical protein